MPYYLYKIYALLLFCAISLHIEAQDFYQSYKPDSGSFINKNIALHLENNNFIKNNEYFGDYTEGLTYIGSVFQPSLRWEITDNLTLSTGWYFRYFYEKTDFNKSIPFIRLTYSINPHMQLTLGQLNTQLNHNHIEPLYDIDRYFSQNPEYGLQFMVKNNKLSSECYLDWEKFILHGDAAQEIINAGMVSSYLLTTYGSNNGLFAEFQATIKHKGGQGITIDAPMQTRSNISPGFRYTHAMQNNIIQKITLAAYYIQAFEMSPNNRLSAKRGFAIYPYLSLQNKYINFISSYLYGDNYFSPLGSYLFQSFSEIHQDDRLISKKRQIWASKLLFDYPITHGVLFGFKAETYYDLKAQHLDYSYGLNISLNLDVFKKHLNAQH